MKLFTTGHPLRFFLVPDDAEWPAGEVTVIDVLGRPRSADLAALSRRFEVPREVALAWSRGERARAEAQVVAREAERQAGRKRLVAALERRTSAQGFDRDRVASLFEELGLDLDRLLADEEATADLFAEFVSVAMLAAVPEKRDVVLPALKQVLRRHGHPEASEKLDAATRAIDREIDAFLEALRASGGP